MVLKGRASQIERMQDVYEALDLPLFPWNAAPKHRFIRIEPEDVSGRRFHVVAGPVSSSTGPSAPAGKAPPFVPSE